MSLGILSVTLEMIVALPCDKIPLFGGSLWRGLGCIKEPLAWGWNVWLPHSSLLKMAAVSQRS
jgi:hypothetical protein